MHLECTNPNSWFLNNLNCAFRLVARVDSCITLIFSFFPCTQCTCCFLKISTTIELDFQVCAHNVVFIYQSVFIYQLSTTSAETQRAVLVAYLHIQAFVLVCLSVLQFGLKRTFFSRNYYSCCLIVNQ